MPPVCEVVRFPSSAAYRTDPSTLHEAYDILHGIDGVQATYHGLQIGDSGTLYGFILWGTMERHKTFTTTQTYAKEFIPTLQKSLSGPASLLYHVHFSVDPRLVLRASAVELVYLTVQLRGGGSPAEEDLAEMKSHLKASVHEGAWGQAEEKRNVFVVLGGLKMSESGYKWNGTTKLVVKSEMVRIGVAEYKVAKLSYL
ncbi:hypothetical protein EUX98_g3581 [Antrodiella citrinella]|uniref:Uncharacterized protein n=1 Tax=Antrodiella citrinella TaxID=2447956 RepID=A0A4V3XIV1_9APHY|nr:hypothetical protein EUX98_g3581 [Antrodiella citrinella]